ASASAAAPAGAAGRHGGAAEPPKRRIKRVLPAPPPKAEGPDVRTLRPNRNGMIRLRGRTDKGRRWQQEIDYDLAVTLVREHMAVVVNPFTIRRLYTNKAFRHYILTRDHYTCFFCGEYGDTIDHLLPRAKGGHTTPVNCVCACNLCNQSKADRWLDEFMQDDA
ncbi:HNH endonuclease, partial [Paenibacillus barengoltzii]